MRFEPEEGVIFLYFEYLINNEVCSFPIHKFSSFTKFKYYSAAG